MLRRIMAALMGATLLVNTGMITTSAEPMTPEEIGAAAAVLARQKIR